MSDLLKELPDTIHIDVGYFDADERAALDRYPNSQRIRSVVESGAHVKKSQFLAYYLYHKRRPGKEGYRDFAQLGSQIHRALAELEDWVVADGDSIVIGPDVEFQDRAITERIGEAAGLCIAGEIHDIHDADWDRIPEHHGRRGFPTFDFRRDAYRASDGRSVIQLETKGTSVPDSTEMSKNIRTHKANIDKKKEKIKIYGDAYAYPADIRYGVISAIGKTGRIHCWLTDPPGDEHEVDPRRYRLLARLHFMFDWISFLGARSRLAASLATRISALTELEDPFVLGGIPLLKSNGKEYMVEYGVFSRRSTMLGHLCSALQGTVLGTLVKSPDRRLLFLGVDRRAYEMVVKQDLDGILTYKSLCGINSTMVDCVLPRGRARRMGLEDLDRRARKNSAYISFSAKGILHRSQGGAVFGVVSPSADWPHLG